MIPTGVSLQIMNRPQNANSAATDTPFGLEQTYLETRNRSKLVYSDMEMDIEYGPFICGIIMLILCILGFIANIFSLFIFTRPSMTSSINVFLAGLSGIDATVLLFAIPTFVIPAIAQVNGLEVITLFGLYQISMMAQTCSVWTFVLISLERYLAVVHPFKVHRYLTVKRARIGQLSVAGASIVYNIIRFWEYELVGVDGQFRRALRDDSVYFTFYYTTSYLLSHFLAPFLLIAILNILILLAIKKAQKQRTKLTDRQTQQKKTTQMIVLVTAVFAICNTLPFVLNIWEALRSTLFDPDDEWQSWAFLILDLSNVLVVVNSSTTVCIYLIYCHKYRVLWIFYVHRYFCPFCPSNAINRYLSREQRKISNSFRNRDGRIRISMKNEGANVKHTRRDNGKLHGSTNSLVLSFNDKSKGQYTRIRLPRTSLTSPDLTKLADQFDITCV